MELPDSCPFCKPDSVRVIASSGLALAIWDKFPISPGHALVVPKRHIASWFSASTEERFEMIKLLDRARDIVKSSHAPDSFNIGINDGTEAGQTVPHLHIHLIPRYAGDSLDPRGGVRWLFPDKAKYW
jgi:diadenosine tetraphosphate (Ap4A) HIT family hydrolase